MKLDSGSKKPLTKWRLSRTLKRSVSFRPIENADLKYVWAAYKKGSLASLSEEFADGLMSVEEFKHAFEKNITTAFHAAWTLFAGTSKGPIPVGIVFGSWPSSRPTFMLIEGMCWFPWASRRNIVEASIGFLNALRREIQMQFYALPEHKRLYEVHAMHGIVRRIGTSYSAFPGKAAALFETRAA